MQIDTTDRKILSQLDQGARRPVSEIAKALRISRTIVDYRIRKLKRQGIIRSFSSFIDSYKFGFSSWKVYIQFQNTTRDIEEEMMQMLAAHNHVWWVVRCFGTYDLLYSVFAKDIEEFNNVLEQFHDRFSQYILKEDINNHLEAQYSSRGYLTNSAGTPISGLLLSKPLMEKVDDTDIAILRLLGNDARLNAVEIAKMVKTSARAVIYRIKNLEKRKIVGFHRLSLDINALDLDFYKGLLYLKNTTEKKINSLRQFCVQHPRINMAVKSIGPWQFEVEMEVEGFKEFNQVIQELKDQFPDMIIRADPLLLYDEKKAEFNFLDYINRSVS
ncbi:MAG: Lrp/AsnC family transcriptional regulator [archaeon]